MTAQKEYGTVVYYNRLKKYGFVKSDFPEPDIFVHLRHCAGMISLYEGQRVRYLKIKDLKMPSRGHQAIQVEPELPAPE